MKKLLFALPLLLLLSCDYATPERITKREATEQSPSRMQFLYKATFDCCNTLYVIEVDGCQYLVTDTGHGGAIVHKANCQNPAHKQQ